MFEGDDADTLKTPFLSPIANAFAESWIGTLQRECLNQFFCFSLRHHDHIVQTYTDYYNVSFVSQQEAPVTGAHPATPDDDAQTSRRSA